VGSVVGATVGSIVGFAVGSVVGSVVGTVVGAVVGFAVGSRSLRWPLPAVQRPAVQGLFYSFSSWFFPPRFYVIVAFSSAFLQIFPYYI